MSLIYVAYSLICISILSDISCLFFYDIFCYFCDFFVILFSIFLFSDLFCFLC